MVSEQRLAQAVSRSQMLRWLKKHAMRLPAGPLTATQERDITECFKLLDEDGSGALDISELVKAFKMLGFKADRSSVKTMMRQVQGENREELQQHEFRSLMAHSLTQDGNSGSSQSSDASPMSFQEIARATKRAKDLEAVLAGGQKRQDFIEKTSSPVTTARSNRRKAPARPLAKQNSGEGHRSLEEKYLKDRAKLISNVQLEEDLKSLEGHKMGQFKQYPHVQTGDISEAMSKAEAEKQAEELISQNLEIPWQHRLLALSKRL